MPLSRCHRFVIIGHDNFATSIVISIRSRKGKGKNVLFRALWKLNGVPWRGMITTNLQFTEGYNFNLNEKGERDFID